MSWPQTRLYGGIASDQALCGSVGLLGSTLGFMYVWIVTLRGWEDETIERVFETKEQAVAYRSRHGKLNADEHWAPRPAWRRNSGVFLIQRHKVVRPRGA